MRQLREASNDVADGVDAGLGSLHCFADFDEAAIQLDLCLVDTDVGNARRPAHGDEDFLGLLFYRLAVRGGPDDLDAGFGLLDFRPWPRC